MTIEGQQKSIEGESAILTLEAIQASLESGKPIEVKVKRSSGEIESGWSIVQMFLGEGDEPVKVKVVGESGSKVVSLDSVQKWNSPEGTSITDSAEMRESDSAEAAQEGKEAPKKMADILTPESIQDLLGKRQTIEVSVKRSSGEIESGWNVTDLYLGVGNEPVRVKVVSGTSSKVVSLDNLKAWNLAKDEEYDEEKAARSPGR